jgi:hypothetical protein
LISNTATTIRNGDGFAGFALKRRSIRLIIGLQLEPRMQRTTFSSSQCGQ